MRFWTTKGDDLLSANDIKEGMEYAGRVKNTKIAVTKLYREQVSTESINITHILFIFLSLKVT